MECKYKVAWIPWSDSIAEDSIFHGDENDYHVKIAKECENIGIEIHTIDMYENLEEADILLFLIISICFYWIRKGCFLKQYIFRGSLLLLNH